MSVVAPVRRRQTVLVAATLVCAASMLVLGAWAFLAPESFSRFIDYAPYNRHLIHDAGAFQLGIGVSLLAALWWTDGLLVALTGFAVASGAIGTPLTRQLVAHDHQVLGLTRDWDGARRLQALGARRFLTQSVIFGYGYRDHGPACSPRRTRSGSRPGTPATRTWPPCARPSSRPSPRPRGSPFVVGTSMRVSNAKATAELGWRPLYPNYRAGVHAMAAATKEEPCRSPGRSDAGTRSA